VFYKGAGLASDRTMHTGMANFRGRTHPSPLTGSHPVEAVKPTFPLHPGLAPCVTSLRTSGWAYCRNTKAQRQQDLSLSF
jgi:hypothetical protein